MKFKKIFSSSRSFTFELINKAIYYAPKQFDVLVNGVKTLIDVKTNVFSIYNLEPNTTYKVTVDSETHEFKTDQETASLNVRDFGATGDGKTDDTMAIQSAIYAAPKGSRVLIPAGTYWVRPLFLVSDITIELVKEATLLGETDRTKYPILPAQILNNDEIVLELNTWEGVPEKGFASIITGINVSNVKVIGEGVIDENSQNSDWWVNHKEMRIAWRPKGVFLSNCEQIGFQGITVTNTPSWNLHPYFSNKIDFIDMKLISPKDSPNTDGCNPESCDQVNVIGVNFSVGDDCIAIKSGKYEIGMKYRQPTSNMTIRNCMMAYGHGGVVLGSEMSGGIKNLTVTQCYFLKTDRGLRIKTRRGRGESAVLDGITFENIYMKDVLIPLTGNMFYNRCDPDRLSEYVWSKEKLPIDEKTPYLGKFTFKDIVCEDAHAAGAYFYGLPEQPIKEINLENVKISIAKEAQSFEPVMMCHLDKTIKLGLVFKNVETVNLKNVEITGYEGKAIDLENVKNFKQS